MKFISIMAAALMLLGFASCHTNHEHSEEESKSLVTSPIVLDTSISRDYVCQIRAISHIELRALDRGYLQDIYVDEGQFVKKGQLMFQIMPLKYRAEFQKAKAEANYAEIEYENTKILADSNVISSRQLALIQAKWEKAKAELAVTEVELGFTEIHAPFDGIMDRFQVRLGSLLEEGELLSTLSDNSQMWVYFNVPEAEYLDYMSKFNKDSLLQVKLLMANNKLFSQKGYVEAIEADFNNETGNIAFRATFPNPKRLLRHGETGTVIISDKLPNALIIPQKATFEILDKIYVFVIDENNVVKSREIKISAELPHLFVIESGLTENDIILLEGLRKVRNNDKISVQFQKPDSVISHLDLYAE